METPYQGSFSLPSPSRGRLWGLRRGTYRAAPSLCSCVARALRSRRYRNTSENTPVPRSNTEEMIHARATPLRPKYGIMMAHPADRITVVANTWGIWLFKYRAAIIDCRSVTDP